MSIFNKKQPCSNNCGKETRRLKNDKPLCAECEVELQLKQRLSVEANHICPTDGTTMLKEFICDNEIIIDRCPKCHGVWLDKEELDFIQEFAESEGSSGGNFSTGLIVGMAIG